MTRKSVLIAAAMLLVFNVMSAQTEGFTVKLKLIENGSDVGVGYATVSLTKEGSEKVYKYAQTDGDGAVAIKGVEKGTYVVEGILLGYKNYKETVTIEKDTDLGTKKMDVDAEMLEGATVSDVGNPIIVKKDTIEHNVSLMKVSDTDVLEDLLKRLPGVEVSSDGSITANGKNVSGIQIDGREFFSNDPKMATRNLPANIIDKVRVVEKKSDQAIFTGIDDGQETTVLDLGIKGGSMNGLMGNLALGGGTDLHNAVDKSNGVTDDFRYQSNLMLATFTTKSQTALIGNANNGGNMGFGGMSMGARGGGMRGGGGGGITSSWMGGLNGGYTFENNDELIINGSANGSSRYVENGTRRQTFNVDGSVLDATEESRGENHSYSVSASSRADFTVTDKTSFIFEPSFSYGWGDSRDTDEFVTDGITADGRNRKVNDGNSLNTGNDESISASARLMWRQRFDKAGRTLSVNSTYSYSKNNSDGLNYSLRNEYSDLDENGKQTMNAVITDQFYNQWSNSNGINARATFTEPFGQNFYGELNYSINYSKSTSGKDTFNKDAKGEYSIFDDVYSSDVINTRLTQSAGFNIRKQEEKYNFTVGATIEPSKQVNETHNAVVDTTLTLDVINWSPQARVDFNFTDYKVLRINYRGRSSHPSINQLMPLPDNTNPLRVTLGNLDLNPSFSHSMDVSYRVTNLKDFSSWNISIDGSLTPSNIVNASWNDMSGVQYSLPMNSNRKTYSAGGNVTYNTPIGTSKFSLMSQSSFNYSNGVSYNGSSSIDINDPKSYLNINNYVVNEYQNVSASENLRLTYRNTRLEVTAGASTRYSQAFYSITSRNVPATWNNGLNTNVIYRSDAINFSTDARYNFYKGYSAGYNEPTLVWNAEVSKNVLKSQGTIAIRVNDILNQSRSTSRTTTDNYVLDSRTNVLGRFFIISFTYRFNAIKGGQGGGMRMGGFGGMGGRGGFGGPGGFGGGRGRF